MMQESRRMPQKMLVNRITYYLLTRSKPSNFGRAVEETLSEFSVLGEAFDFGNFSFVKLVRDVEKRYAELA
jgi:hypothetical protein